MMGFLDFGIPLLLCIIRVLKCQEISATKATYHFPTYLVRKETRRVGRGGEGIREDDLVGHFHQPL
jgi:hypothetical protein